MSRSDFHNRLSAISVRRARSEPDVLRDAALKEPTNHSGLFKFAFYVGAVVSFGAGFLATSLFTSNGSAIVEAVNSYLFFSDAEKTDISEGFSNLMAGQKEHVSQEELDAFVNETISGENGDLVFDLFLHSTARTAALFGVFFVLFVIELALNRMYRFIDSRLIGIITFFGGLTALILFQLGVIHA